MKQGIRKVKTVIRRKLPSIFLSEINSRKGDVNAFIAAYILEHLEEIQDDSIRELAAKNNTSPSAISRFCRETGIKDYNELKDMIRNTALCCETGSCADTPEQRRDDYLAAVEHSLELVRSSLDLNRLCEPCLDIRSYARVAVFGVLEAGSVALNLHSHLLMQGKLVFTKISVAEQLKFIRSVGADGLIGFFSETGAEYDYGLSELRQKKADQQPKIWIVTDNPEAEKTGLYDGVLLFASTQDQAMRPYQLQVIAGMIAQQYAYMLRKRSPKDENGLCCRGKRDEKSDPDAPAPLGAPPVQLRAGRGSGPGDHGSC